MSILVADAIWPWRGQRWAHLISDSSHQELHAFATAVGRKRVSFQGDHYDINTECRERAIAAGAKAVNSRQIVGSLRDAGLRRRPADAKIAWRFDVRTVLGDRPALEAALLDLPKLHGVADLTQNALGILEQTGLSKGPIELATLRGADDLAVVITAPEQSWNATPDVTGLDGYASYVSQADGAVTVEFLTGPGTTP